MIDKIEQIMIHSPIELSINYNNTVKHHYKQKE